MTDWKALAVARGIPAADIDRILAPLAALETVFRPLAQFRQTQEEVARNPASLTVGTLGNTRLRRADDTASTRNRPCWICDNVDAIELKQMGIRRG